MNSHDIRLLKEAATQLTEDGRHPGFYRLCESYGRWVRSGERLPHLCGSFLANKCEQTSTSHLQISDQVGLFLDGLLCELRTLDSVAYHVLEIMFMTRNEPALVRAKNVRLVNELKRQGKRPTRALMDELKTQSIEALRGLVLIKLNLTGVYMPFTHKGQVWK